VATDPPIGRIGYLMDGMGDGTVGIPGKSVRCNGCRTWFAAAEMSCSRCGHSRPGFNKSIRTAQLNNVLYNQIAQAEKQKVRGLA
jgi:hypothetical protein